MKPVAELVKGAEDLAVLVEFAEMGEDAGDDPASIMKSLNEQFAAAELQAMLSGQHDGNNVDVAAGEEGGEIGGQFRR